MARHGKARPGVARLGKAGEAGAVWQGAVRFGAARRGMGSSNQGHLNMGKIITIRASSIKTLLDCPARFEATQIRGIRMPTNGKAQLGRAVHASTAVFDQANIDGSPVTADDAAGALVDAIHRPDDDVEWDDDLTARDAENIGLSLHRKYCDTIAPQQVYAAVEANCDRMEITDLGIALTGTTDRIRRTDSGFGIADLKTGKQAVHTDGTVDIAKHITQLGVYELLAESATGVAMTEPAQVIGMQTGKTEKAQRIGMREVTTARDLLVGTEHQPGVLEFVAKLVHQGLFYGNPSSPMCSPKYCPVFQTCHFKG